MAGVMPTIMFIPCRPIGKPDKPIIIILGCIPIPPIGMAIGGIAEETEDTTGAATDVERKRPLEVEPVARPVDEAGGTDDPGRPCGLSGCDRAFPAKPDWAPEPASAGYENEKSAPNAGIGESKLMKEVLIIIFLMS
jgi:hypothetical protein